MQNNKAQPEMFYISSRNLPTYAVKTNWKVRANALGQGSRAGGSRADAEEITKLFPFRSSIMLKKFVFFAAAAGLAFCFASCNEKKPEYPIPRIEVFQDGTHKSGYTEITINRSYVFTAKFYNAKDEEKYVEYPERIVWTKGDSQSQLSPNTGENVTFSVYASTPPSQMSYIQVDYEGKFVKKIDVHYIN
jgi:hypothetical protein